MGPVDLATPCAALRLAASLAARPGAVLRRGAGLVAELGSVGLGTSTSAPHRGDDRFDGDGWLTDPVRRRAVQAYLATTGALSGLLDDAVTPGGARPRLGPDDEARLRGVLGYLADLTFPTMALVAPDRPATGAEPGRDARPVFGRDVAATPGAVVLRTPMFELLQYLPRTEHVYEVPVLVVPPLVHRYYLADLCPGHSLVDHLVGAGLQVFALSWADPEPDTAAGRDLDTYAAAVLDAIDACTRVTRCPRVALAGVRTGGLLSAAVQSHMGAIGRGDRVAAAVYLGTALDQRSALPGFRPDPAGARTAGGLLDGAEAVRSWAWRRGGEQIRPFAVDPAAADRLPADAVRRALHHWAGDLLRVPAALHADLAALAADDPERPDATVLGTPVEPHRLTCDAYLVIAEDDPVQPLDGRAPDGSAARRVAAPGPRERGPGRRAGRAGRLPRGPGDRRRRPRRLGVRDHTGGRLLVAGPRGLAGRTGRLSARGTPRAGGPPDAPGAPRTGPLPGRMTEFRSKPGRGEHHLGPRERAPVVYSRPPWPHQPNARTRLPSRTTTSWSAAGRCASWYAPHPAQDLAARRCSCATASAPPPTSSTRSSRRCRRTSR